MEQEYTVTLSSNGRLTVPAEIRQRLALACGTGLRLRLREDGTVELSRPEPARIADVAGIGRGRTTTLAPSAAREVAREEHWRAKQERSQ